MSKDNKRLKEPRVEKYRVTLADDNTHKQLGVMHFTRWTFFLTVISGVMLFLAGAFAIVAFTPLKTLLPGYPDAHTRSMTIQNALTVDSLQNVISRWEFYTENLKSVLAGGTRVGIDSVMKAYETVSGQEYSEAQLRENDSLLREKVVQAEQFAIRGSKRTLPLEGIHFFTPLQGVVSNAFVAGIHPYVDITAPANSVVMSVLEGTVVAEGWSDEYEYTVVIQHPGDLISVYRRNQKLLKKTGDRVTAGMPIALVAGSSSQTAGDHLHFELWYKGEAVDPAKYINF